MHFPPAPSPPDETDGPPGALAMATMLLALGKQVTMVTDRRALQMNQVLVEEAVRTGGDTPSHITTNAVVVASVFYCSLADVYM